MPYLIVYEQSYFSYKFLNVGWVLDWNTVFWYQFCVFCMHTMGRIELLKLPTPQYIKVGQKNRIKEGAYKMQRQHDYVIKMVMVGSSAVGKSALVKRFADNEYNEFYISTIGIDFRFKSVNIGEFYVKLQLWDTAGQQRFKGITKSYYNNADVCIIVYDINQNKSFDDIKNLWLNQARTYCKNDVQIFVLCNKCDHTAQAPTPIQRKFFDENKIGYFMVSAKTGKGVQEAIMAIAKKMITIIPKVAEKSLSLELRQTHFQGGLAKAEKDKKCC